MISPFRPALLRTLRSGYRLGDLYSDCSAGILVGVVALPLAIAFAVASGAQPAQGFATAIVAGTLISLLGGSRVQIGGPTGAFVGLCATVVASHGYDGLALATLMAGVLLVFMGLLRLGKAIAFIPAPVVVGFTSGIAVTIASTQLRDAIGLREWPLDNPAHVADRVWAVLQYLGSWSPLALALCLGTVVGIVFLRRISPRLPAALLVLTLFGALAWWLHLDVATIGTRYPVIPAGLPLPRLPQPQEGGTWSLPLLLDRLRELSGPALAIAVLAGIESLLSAMVADSMAKDRHDANTELIAQGIANLSSPLFGGLPATGAIARTATNIRAGARTPIAGLIHAATLLAISLLAAPLVAAIPMACLAGVLLVVAWGMSEFHRWPQLLRLGRSDALLLPLSFLLTVFVDVTVAVEVGVLLGMFFFVKRMIDVTQARKVTQDHTGTWAQSRQDPDIEIFEVEGPFFFGTATMLRDLLHELHAQPPHVLILRVRHVPFIDATAIASLRELLDDCRAQGVILLLADVRPAVSKVLKRSGLTEAIGPDRLHLQLAAALEHAQALCPDHTEETAPAYINR